MYLEYFGFEELPFTLTPHTRLYCDLSSHEEALQVLAIALRTGESLIKVIGEVGTGKTLLCRRLLTALGDDFYPVYIPNPSLNPSELRYAVAAELQIDLTHVANAHQLNSLIEAKMLELSRNGQSIVIVIDEAQVMPLDSLETVRLLSNIETETHKLIQLVLFGQPELDERLAKREARQLRQRVGFSLTLAPFNESDIKKYIEHRLKASNYSGRPIFSDKAISAIFHGSRGVPRLINILCHKSLLLAFGNQVQQVSAAHVAHAIADTDDASALPTSRLKPFFIGISVAGVICLAGWFVLFSGLVL